VFRTVSTTRQTSTNCCTRGCCGQSGRPRGRRQRRPSPDKLRPPYARIRNASHTRRRICPGPHPPLRSHASPVVAAAPPSHTAASDSPGYGSPGRATTANIKNGLTLQMLWTDLLTHRPPPAADCCRTKGASADARSASWQKGGSSSGVLPVATPAASPVEKITRLGCS